MSVIRQSHCPKCNESLFNVIDICLQLGDELIDISAPDEQYYRLKNNPATIFTTKKRCVKCRHIWIGIEQQKVH